MQGKLTNSPAPASSKASSFFIENILGKGRTGQESTPGSSQGGAGLASVSRVLDAVRSDGSSSTARSPLQWYRGDLGALKTPYSE